MEERKQARGGAWRGRVSQGERLRFRWFQFRKEIIHVLDLGGRIITDKVAEPIAEIAIPGCGVVSGHRVHVLIAVSA